jgi:HAMP domain-containing protein
MHTPQTRKDKNMPPNEEKAAAQAASKIILLASSSLPPQTTLQHLSHIPAKRFLDDYFIQATFYTWLKSSATKPTFHAWMSSRNAGPVPQNGMLNVFKLLDFLSASPELPSCSTDEINHLQTAVDTMRTQWAAFENTILLKPQRPKTIHFNAWKLVHALQDPLRFDQETKKAAADAESILMYMCNTYMDTLSSSLTPTATFDTEAYKSFVPRDTQDLLMFSEADSEQQQQQNPQPPKEVKHNPETQSKHARRTTAARKRNNKKKPLSSHQDHSTLVDKMTELLLGETKK